MSECALKYENDECNFQGKLYSKTVYCFFGLRGNLDFPDFLKKKFYNLNS